MDHALFQYYLKELAHIEDECAEFAKRHPQVASRLTLGSAGNADPHVRQLIESVAFISARLRRHMDGLSGEIVHALLQLTCPGLVRPVPSMAIVRFEPSSSSGELIATKVPRGGLLRARAGQDEICMLSIPGGATLWPLQVQTFWAGELVGDANRVLGFSAENCFVIRISSNGQHLKLGQPQSLSFFITGPLNRAMAAIEAMALGVLEIHLQAKDGSWKLRLPASAIQMVGFGDFEERLIPTNCEAENLGGMILEYLLFPQRFCIFRVDGLTCPVPCSSFDIVLVLQPKAVPSIDATKNNIVINCVPVVNVYPRASVPIGLNSDAQLSECLIPADLTRKGPWDVYSIDQVRLLGGRDELVLPEYFSSVRDATEASFY